MNLIRVLELLILGNLALWIIHLRAWPRYHKIRRGTKWIETRSDE